MNKNTLYYGDNLHILKDYIKDESVDLIYLDPPFNSKRAYNAIYKSGAQVKAFDDTWHWDDIAFKTYNELLGTRLREVIMAMKTINGETPMTAYLVMMAIRLLELHRVLKQTGSLYLHCDPTASHYLKIILDVIFGVKNFRNEIVWCYKRWTAASNRLPRLHDIILFYGKSKNTIFNNIMIQNNNPNPSQYVSAKDKNGKTIIAKDINGTPIKRDIADEIEVGDWWEMPIISPNGNERLGYPTQKPVALLERIVKASSNEGDVVLDPFCGCGTAMDASQKLGRKWIGIDIAHISIQVQKERLLNIHGLKSGKDYEIIGEPKDMDSVRLLAKNGYDFQKWVCVQLGAIYQEKNGKIKKGSDGGVDGIIPFDNLINKDGTCIVSVKSGKTGAKDVRDLIGTLNNKNAEMGLFVCLQEPTRDMKKEALSAGLFGEYQKVQILTAQDILNEKKPDMPSPQSIYKESKPNIKAMVKKIFG